VRDHEGGRHSCPGMLDEVINSIQAAAEPAGRMRNYSSDHDKTTSPALRPGILLDPFEIRVLAVLAEKEALTPDNYPMSLNAIMNGCNQLSSRDPVMQLSEDRARHPAAPHAAQAGGRHVRRPARA
jgi:hypothetical protein